MAESSLCVLLLSILRRFPPTSARWRSMSGRGMPLSSSAPDDVALPKAMSRSGSGSDPSPSTSDEGMVSGSNPMHTRVAPISGDPPVTVSGVAVTRDTGTTGPDEFDVSPWRANPISRSGGASARILTRQSSRGQLQHTSGMHSSTTSPPPLKTGCSDSLLGGSVQAAAASGDSAPTQANPLRRTMTSRLDHTQGSVVEVYPDGAIAPVSNPLRAPGAAMLLLQTP